MKPVERLHIDELKRTEKQINTMLKVWRKLKNDYANLEKQYLQLESVHQQSSEAHNQMLEMRLKEHQEALNQLENDWQERHDNEIIKLREEMTEQIRQHQNILNEQELKYQQEMSGLQEVLALEQKIKSALVARVRGVSHG